MKQTSGDTTQHGQHLPSTLRVVDVRILAARHGEVGVFAHRRSDVGMKVQQHTERDIRSDDLARSRDEFALAVVDSVGHLCAVQTEHHHVDGQSRA